MLSIIKVATCKLVNRYGINTNKRLKNSSFSWTLTRTRTSPPQPITTAISSLYHHHYQRSFVEVLRKTMSSTTTPPISEDANNNDDSRKRPSSSVDGTDNNDSTNIAVAATETSSSTPSSSSQPQQKQQGDNNNNNNKESSSSKRPWKKGKKDNSKSKHGRGGIKDYGDGARDKREDPPQLGSYANPAMREMYGVTLDFEPTTTATTNDDGDDKNTTETKDTVKRKVALLLGFLGTKYGGFQINPEQKTIQAEIELALYRSGMISKDNFGTQHKYSWSNSARTDKGVHACAQVCSLKLELPEDDWEAHNDNKTEEERLDGPRQRLQKNLPDDICVLSMSRTTRNFCAKTQRDRVRYQYMIPSFLLHPDWRTIMTEQGIDINSGREARENYSKMPLSVEVAKKVQLILREYRSTEDSRDLLQSALRKYEGTHPFHNFTKGIKPGQPQGKRYIELFEVQDPVIVDGMEWIPTQVLGQSFLLHQIRKMVCVAVDIARGAVPIEFIDKALSNKESLALHVAPAQGLFLEMSYFDGYNRRKNSQSNHDLLDLNWTVDGPVQDRWMQFRDIVRDHIVQEEENEMNFIQYLFRHECIYDCRKVYGYDADTTSEQKSEE